MPQPCLCKSSGSGHPLGRRCSFVYSRVLRRRFIAMAELGIEATDEHGTMAELGVEMWS